MKTLTIRNIDDELSNILKLKAKGSGKSINSLILNILNQATGLSKKKFTKEYDDLDSLAGTWSVNEFNEFEKNTSSFNNIDKEMWE